MQSKAVIILGIDPGTLITGYGLIRVEKGRPQLLDFGRIRPGATLPLAERYLIIFNGIEELIRRHKPDALSIELQFVLKNPQSALKLGMARGMAILAAARAGIPTSEYPPTRAKQAVVGKGLASKHQVQRMIQAIFSLQSPPEEDEADALALALCHANQLRSPCLNLSQAPSARKIPPAP